MDDGATQLTVTRDEVVEGDLGEGEVNEIEESANGTHYLVEREVWDRMVKLAIRSHYYCEDCWYTCPKHPEGCCDDKQGDECNCGADEHNAEVRALAEIGGVEDE